jgi:sorting nexin-9/18/33
MRVKTLYDFSGEPKTSEISIFSGEILTVTRTDVGEGWWEGTNSKGETGLFPAAYVEPVAEVAQKPVVNNNAPAFPPPQLPRYDQTNDDWNDQQEDTDDDWDDDHDTYSEIGPASLAAGASGTQHQQQQTFKTTGGGSSYESQHLPAPPADDTISITSTNMPIKSKSKIFSKSGDSYILGTTTPNVSDNEKVYIVQNEHGCFWHRTNSENYTVAVRSPKKETKFKGMKSFIAYQLTPSFTGIAVSRRYKHFDWLHERLVDKFCLIPVPPLPDKQISGRYEETFIEHRRVQLQEFVDWMCRHPVLSNCEVWQHFLTCTDEKKWKQGKRIAEKDPLIGATYCAVIVPPERQLLQSVVDSQTDLCTTFSQGMDSAVKNLFAICNDQSKKYQTVMKKDFQRVGDGFSELAKALEIDERRATTNICLSNSVGKTAAAFIKLGGMYGEQHKYDWIPFADRLHIYRGILSSFPDILAEHKNAIAKRKECERLTAEQRMGNLQLQEVNRRTDTMSYTLIAEVSHFREERDTHLRQTIRNFIAEQVKFYQKIVDDLQATQKLFEN